jgi:L-seryl-tRNA(Ser) seleniumtransferase
VHRVLAEPLLRDLEAQWGHQRVAEAVAESLEQLRRDLSLTAGGGPLDARPPSPAAVARQAADRLAALARPRLRRVINATGVVLHTNLGRAPLSAEAIEAVRATAGRYSNLEMDLERGERGSRYAHVDALIRRLTGAEAALVVNNNAAAVLLALAAVAAGREVVVSRGELVEIGGAFRIPDVMAQSGARLREVGTTNRTRADDYRRAVGPETAALLKVHQSNFRIVGFTEEASVAELSGVAHETALPLLHDLGSGSLVDLAPFGLTGEPTVQGALADGADLVTFSGDKLLGGPQAGVICGRAAWVALCRRHPLNRALRIDKLTLAALEATLRAYLHPEAALRSVPALRALTRPADELRRDADELALDLGRRVGGGAEVAVVEESSRAGGGSLPDATMPSWCVAVAPADTSLDDLVRRLRSGDPAVVARVQDGRLLLDPRTLLPGDAEALARRVAEGLRGGGSAGSVPPG